LWAAPHEIDGEYGGTGTVSYAVSRATRSLVEGTKRALMPDAAAPGHNTTIGLVATDAELSPAEARRIAIMAADGMARAIRPVHTPFDGDIVFVLATGTSRLEGPRALALAMLGGRAADTMARAIGRGVWHADSIAGWQSLRDAHGRTGG
jgi:L-aminopeptidase/D-esterase-like protein